MSKTKFSAMIAIVIITAIVSVSITAFVLTQNNQNETTDNVNAAVAAKTTTENPAAVDEEKHSNEVIVMRSYYIGYFIDNPDQLIADTVADGKGGSNICAVLEKGQRYNDTMTGADFIMLRKEGSEEVPFRLPETSVIIYDLRGQNYQTLKNGINTDAYEEYDTIMTDYGQIKLYHQ